MERGLKALDEHAKKEFPAPHTGHGPLTDITGIDLPAAGGRGLLSSLLASRDSAAAAPDTLAQIEVAYSAAPEEVAAHPRGSAPAADVELAAFLAAHQIKPEKTALSLCVFTNELAEFHQNGGLGTATSGLVRSFAARGFNLTVIYTASLDLESAATTAGIAALERLGVAFQPLQTLVPEDWMSAPRKIAYACFWLLRQTQYDIAHFNDYLGNAYYAALARRTGSALGQTTVIITIHGPTRWALSIDERPVSGLAVEEVCFLEFKALEYADAVIGVSHHLPRWLRACGVKLPKHTYIHKNILPAKPPGSVEAHPLAAGALTTIAFFARQDIRKGFMVLLEAIKLLAPSMPNVRFSFIGKFSRIFGEHSGAVALDELRNVPNLLEFCYDFDRERAIKHLRRPGTLAVMPSLDENSPCTVFECIDDHIPFISTNVGGVAELIAPEARAAVLFAPNAKALAEKIRYIARHGIAPAALAFDSQAIEAQMAQGFAVLHGVVQSEYVQAEERLTGEIPLVSIVVTHFNRPQMLENLLKAIARQSYQNFEVIVVDDGSTKPDAISYIERLPLQNHAFPLHVVRIPNSYLGAARNAGIKRARGVYVKFQDDDNIPFPNEIECFVRAALLTGADVVTAMSRFFRNENEIDAEINLPAFEYFPLGASLPLSLFKNEYGDANALFRRASLLEDGGFTETYGVGYEDYELFVKSESLGRKIFFIPEPLFNYRIDTGSMLQTTSLYKGAMRARAGLHIAGQAWVTALVDFMHETKLAEDIAETAWWRAGKREFSDLHKQMLQDDPGCKENIDRFLELCVRYERAEDIIHTVLRHNSLLNSLAWLERTSRRIEDETRHGRSFLSSRPRIVNFKAYADIMLVAPDADLPDFSVFQVEDSGVLVHPIQGRETLVRVGQAIAAGVDRISVQFSHRGDQGETAQVAIEVQHEGRVIAQSPWADVAPRCRTMAVIELECTAIATYDLMLKTTVRGGQQYCWVFADYLCLESVGTDG